MAGSIMKLGSVSFFVALGMVMMPGTGMSHEERVEMEVAAPAREGRGEEQRADGRPTLDQDEEEAERSALENADWRELARTSLMAEYASSTLERLVRADAGDPEELDEATLRRLIEKYTPVASQEAEQWSRGRDPSTIPLAKPKLKHECTNKYKDFQCEEVNTCTYKNVKGEAFCVVTNCGEGRCPACTSIWDLDKLVVKGWCVYACMDWRYNGRHQD